MNSNPVIQTLRDLQIWMNAVTDAERNSLRSALMTESTRRGYPFDFERALLALGTIEERGTEASTPLSKDVAQCVESWARK